MADNHAQVRATCSGCGQATDFPAGLVGTVQECPHCGAFLDVAPAPPEPAPPSPALPVAPALTRRALWGELLAVLAVGVIPPLAGALTGPFRPRVPQPYWLDSLDLTVESACAAVVVLYLIARSGEGWGPFGIGRPRLVDLWNGLLLLLVARMLSRVLARLLPAPDGPVAALFPPPEGAGDFVWLVVRNLANGFTEELITRAYLVTRLTGLLGSRFWAVVVAAALFASYHAYQGPRAMAVIFAQGLLYGVCYLVLPRVWPFALAHAAHDILVELAWVSK